jgi:hypothetical protein
MGLLKTLGDKLARRATEGTARAAKDAAQKTAKKIELALFGDGPAEEARRAELEEEARRRKDREEGGELGRYAARKRKEAGGEDDK